MRTLMRSGYIALSLLMAVSLSALCLIPVAAVKADQATKRHKTALNNSYASLPLSFEANRGQVDSQVRFISRGKGYTLFLTSAEAVLALKEVAPSKDEIAEKPGQKERAKTIRRDSLRIRFNGANTEPRIIGESLLSGRTNYFSGDDPTRWLTDIDNYSKVRYESLYSGIDLLFYGKEGELEYDFLVAPKADARAIAMDFDGARSVKIDSRGDLVLETGAGQVIQRAPLIYQERDGIRNQIAGKYVMKGARRVGFEISDYDSTLPLVIDPVIQYATYIGGSRFDTVRGVATDSSGNAYIVGATNSLDFPTPDSRNLFDGDAAFVAKLDPTGTSFVYFTLLEGEQSDFGNAIAVDAGGNAYVTGETASERFPTLNAFQRSKRHICPLITCLSDTDVFATKLDGLGNLSYSTYLGGAASEVGLSIAVDTDGRAYVTGSTASGIGFPRKNEFQGTGFFFGRFDAFLTVFTPDGSDLVYSTGLGGADFDEGRGVAIDSAGIAYVTGRTDSSDFPIRNGFQASYAGGQSDAFFVKFNPNLRGDSSLIYSTFIGGSGTDKAFAIAAQDLGNVYITGVTGSFDFPLRNALDTTNQINEAFVTVIEKSGALNSSTFLGGNGEEEGIGIAVDQGGTIHVAGSTTSTDFPTALPFQSTLRGDKDAFVTRLRLTDSSPAISSSSYLGGTGEDQAFAIALLGTGTVFVVGQTESSNFPTTQGVIKQTSNASANRQDGFVARILYTRIDTIGLFRPSTTDFFLSNSNEVGIADITIDFGIAGDTGLAGDFNGDSIDTTATFNNGTWTIRNFNVFSGGYLTGLLTFTFGQAGDLPVVGDWDGDGIDTPGVFRNGQFLLRNSNSAGAPDIVINFGLGGDLPVAGDWDGDGIDTVGLYRPSNNTYFLLNDADGVADVVVQFGQAGDLPVTGDWDGDGFDTVGVYRPSAISFFLSNDLRGSIDIITAFGINGDRPIAGDWDGKP